MVLYRFLASWLFGLVLGQWASISTQALTGIAVMAGIALALRFRHRQIRIATGMVLALILGAGWSANAAEIGVETLITKHLTERATVAGTIRGDPVSAGPLIRVMVRVNEVGIGAATPTRDRRAGGVVAWLLTSDLAAGLRNGDTIALTGRLVVPPSFPDFDYRATLERKGITAAMYRPLLEVRDKIDGPVRLVSGARSSMSRSLSRWLPEPASSLARALVLGERDGLTPELRDQWSRAGTAHILSISGLHVGVLLGLILALGTATFGRRFGAHLLVPLIAIWV